MPDPFVAEVMWEKYFVMRFEKQERPTGDEDVLVTISVESLAVEQTWFDEALKICFKNDRGVTLEGNILTFKTAYIILYRKKFLEEKAKELFEILSKHSDWGKLDGPDRLAERDLLA